MTLLSWRTRSGDRLLIRGGSPLIGIYPISGAKNAVLPLMVSALLTTRPVTLHNVPDTLDVAVLARLLQRLGADLHRSFGDSALSLTICASHVDPRRVDEELVTRMRASVLLLGALLARCGEASLPMPGGNAIGLRNIDFHLAGLRAMGASSEQSGGVIKAVAPEGLRGAEIVLPHSSVGATENVLLAAVSANGTTIIRNAACEPEINDLAQCLTAMRAVVSHGQGDDITIQGGPTLSGTAYQVMPDRIEMGTVACAAAMTDGDILLRNGRLDLLGAAAPALIEAGVDLLQTAEGVTARRSCKGLSGVDLQTRPYPGFATDLQAPVMALLSTAVGASMVTETIFEHRFRHVDELKKIRPVACCPFSAPTMTKNGIIVSRRASPTPARWHLPNRFDAIEPSTNLRISRESWCNHGTAYRRYLKFRRLRHGRQVPRGWARGEMFLRQFAN